MQELGRGSRLLGKEISRRKTWTWYVLWLWQCKPPSGLKGFSWVLIFLSSADWARPAKKKHITFEKTVSIGIFLSEFNPYQTYIFCYRNLFINLPHLHHHHHASQEFDNQDAVSCRAHPSNQLPSNPSGIQEQGNNYSKNPNRKSTKTTKRNHRMFGN